MISEGRKNQNDFIIFAEMITNDKSIALVIKPSFKYCKRSS